MPRKPKEASEEPVQDVSRAQVTLWLIGGLAAIVATIALIGGAFDLVRRYNNREKAAAQRAIEERYIQSLQVPVLSSATTSLVETRTLIRTEADIDAFLVSRYPREKFNEMKKAACIVYGVCR